MMKRVLAAVGVAVLVAGLGFGLALYGDALAHRGQILPGVSIMSIPVGGLTPELTRRRVEAVVAARLGRTLGVRAGGAPARPPPAAPGGARQRGGRRPGGSAVPRRFAGDGQPGGGAPPRRAGAVAADPRDARVT